MLRWTAAALSRAAAHGSSMGVLGKQRSHRHSTLCPTAASPMNPPELRRWRTG